MFFEYNDTLFNTKNLASVELNQTDRDEFLLTFRLNDGSKIEWCGSRSEMKNDYNKIKETLVNQQGEKS